jgi:hypothetical protein
MQLPHWKSIRIRAGPHLNTQRAVPCCAVLCVTGCWGVLRGGQLNAGWTSTCLDTRWACGRGRATAVKYWARGGLIHQESACACCISSNSSAPDKPSKWCPQNPQSLRDICRPQENNRTQAARQILISPHWSLSTYSCQFLLHILPRRDCRLLHTKWTAMMHQVQLTKLMVTLSLCLTLEQH